jgi:acetyl-CoA/propionyl-CoA carboxylase biotin carboxyl carrier protein
VSGRRLHQSWRVGDGVWVADLRLEDGRLTGRLAGPAGEVPVDALVRATAPDSVRVRLGGRAHRAVLVRRGASVWVAMDGHVYELVAEDAGGGGGSGPAREPFATSPMTGVVVKVNVGPGERVAAGTSLLVVEAMKMEYAVRAPRDGTVSRVSATVGARVSQGEALVAFEEEA